MVERFLANLTSSIPKDARPGCQPTQIPDIYRFLSRHIFRAEVRALYGETVFAACPSFSKDFVRFYEAFPTIAEGLPRWLAPSSYRARDTMLSHFKAWRAVCRSRSDLYKDQRRVCDYEPVWGSACIRNMVKRHEDLGFSDDSIASAMLGYLFV
ncbi:hypothetical protein F5883DRAFT_596571 [Diaporthe sp. PMI_573]|nr:hypothetical protein F5883DRAFT_596571 [Diaporthaceae sp. PMI_573]